MLLPLFAEAKVLQSSATILKGNRQQKAAHRTWKELFGRSVLRPDLFQMEIRSLHHARTGFVTLKPDALFGLWIIDEAPLDDVVQGKRYQGSFGVSMKDGRG